MGSLACSMRTPIALTASLAAAICLLCWSSQAAAATGSCGPAANAPKCKLQYGTVTFIGDGDTVSVRLDGHKKDPPVHVRITGIQAMEEHVYTTSPSLRTGECHANEATARLEYLVKLSKGRVQLAAQSLSSHSGNRLRRQVRVKINGHWRDVSRILIGEGHALALSNGSEWALNATYSKLSQQAAAARVGLWNSYYCGPGPEDLASLRVWVNSNPAGDDSTNPNGEWVKVKNLDPKNPVAIGGWWMRDSALRRYTFPPFASVPPGGSITMFVGRGTDTETEFFWGLRSGVFDNATFDEHGGGDGAYLFDTEGDLRAWMIYPCRYRCGDPLKGALKVSAHPRSPEYVTVTNVSKAPLDLEGYRLAAGQYGYPFPAGTILQPGDVLRVNVKGAPAEDTALVKNWGLDTAILYDSGGSARVSTFTDIVLACDAWGTGSCSR
jgi:endonuclease YncB( thermonuclease family)